jgi:formamidopyrimidine-DNA glycosylase
MPELPEVETVRRGLAQHLTGARLAHIKVRRGDLRVPVPAFLKESLEGSVLTRIARRAKYLLFHFDNAQVLIAHLGMSGSMLLTAQPPASFRTHDHIIMTWGNGMVMAFHDPRRFGLMLLSDESTLAEHPLLAGLGPEPLDGTITAAGFYSLLHASSASVKTVIMDQRKLVGVGNIYACEALFRARIHPERSADSITKKQASALLAAIGEVLTAAIASGGSTLRDYVRSSGDGGYFQHHFKVYGRGGEPCCQCGEPIRSIRQSGRSTFFCAKCQR